MTIIETRDGTTIDTRILTDDARDMAQRLITGGKYGIPAGETKGIGLLCAIGTARTNQHIVDELNTAGFTVRLIKGKPGMRWVMVNRPLSRRERAAMDH